VLFARLSTIHYNAITAMRRLLPILAVVALVATACQPAAPAAEPTMPAPATAAAPTSPPAIATVRPAIAPATAAPAAPTSLPTPPPQPAAQPARPTPTSLPVLATSSLGTLGTEQRGAARSGQAAVAAGDYARAISILEPLANQTSGEAQAEVRLLVGQALVGDRQFDKALGVADELVGSQKRADLVSASRLLKGQALRGLERWAEAATEMRAVADNNPLVGPAVRLELEDMWLDEANQPDQAAADGTKGLLDAQPRLLKIELAEKLGKAQVALNDTDAAMDAYRQLLTAAGTTGFLGEQLYNLAEGASALGRNDEAINALRTSIERFPRSRKAPDAVVLLEKLGGMRAEDRYFAGVIRYLFWNFRGARADFDAYLDALPDGDHALEARYYKGLSSPASQTTAQLLALADAAPDDDIAPLALYEAGKAQEELGDYARAEQIYDRLVASYASRDAGVNGAFRRGLARFMRDNPVGALAAWDELLARSPEPPVRAQALYWSSKALSGAGNEPAAQGKLRAAAAVRPVDYYVMRAQVALEGPPTAGAFVPSEVGGSDESALAAWFASHGLDLTAAAQTASQDPAYLRTVALVQHGLYREANWEHEIFLTTYLDKPDRLYWLASRFGEMGLPNASLKLGTAALNAATAEGQVSILDVPLPLARVASPLAFPDLVANTARARNVDPLLFMSLMHQESDFDPYAESVAKAKGLSQIIPQTAIEIANALGVRGFQQEDLFHPKQNVQFGTWYFSERLKRNGQVARALASYNAGDGNVDTWTLPGRDDPDVFTEFVPFAETHDYVKKIMRYWWINRYLWAR
jgi:soluble lytic murein transglycosylase